MPLAESTMLTLRLRSLGTAYIPLPPKKRSAINPGLISPEKIAANPPMLKIAHAAATSTAFRRVLGRTSNRRRVLENFGAHLQFARHLGHVSSSSPRSVGAFRRCLHVGHSRIVLFDIVHLVAMLTILALSRACE